MSENNEQPEQPQQPEQSQGQVSEVANLTAEGQAPVTPEDTVLGAQDPQTGEPIDPDAVGPDGVPPRNDETNEYDKG